MRPEEQEQLRALIQKMMTDFMQFAQQPRSCQRCEERRQQKDFTSVLPICDICVDTMPAAEIKELAEELRHK